MTEEQFFECLAEPYTEKSSGWTRSVNKLEKKGDGMEVIIYQRKVEGSKMNMIRSDSKLKGVNVKQYKDFMNDTDKIKNDKAIQDFRIIEDFNPAEARKIYYMEMKMPLMKNRTALLDMTFNEKLDNGKQVLMLSQSCERDDVPEVKGKIRMHMLASGLARMEGEYLHLTEFT